MKPLIVLLGVFFLSLMIIKRAHGSYDVGLSGRIALSVMLLFTAMGHFMFTDGMVMMLPDFIPYKVTVVYLTGFIEIAAAAGLFIPSLRVLTAWLLILFFALILPANILAAMEHIDYQNASFDGSGPEYLWFRIPLQILFMGWTYLSAIKPEVSS